MLVLAEGKNAVVRSPNWTTTDMMRIELVPVEDKHKGWKGTDFWFRPTRATLAYIRQEFPQAQFTPVAKRVFSNAIRAATEAQKTALYRTMSDDDVRHLLKDYPFKTEPFAHQYRALAMSVNLPNFALLMEQGTGKTKVAIDTFAGLSIAKQIDALVVLAPNGVHFNWVEEELPTHWPDDAVPYRAVPWSSQPNAAQRRDLEALLDPTKEFQILAMNTEALSQSSKAYEYVKEFLDTYNAAVAVDESHFYKTPGSGRTRKLRYLRDRTRYRRIMTGTPMTKGYEDLYSQFAFLDPDILGYHTATEYRARYCQYGGYDNRQIISYRNVDELAKRMEGHSFRITKDECLDLPERTYTKHFVEMSKEQRKFYQELKEEMITIIDDKTITAEIAIKRMTRLRQLVGGFMTDPNNPELRFPVPGPNPKLDALKLLDETIQGQGIIWGVFKPELKAIGEMLGVPVYDGDAKDSLRAQMKADFKDGRLKWFVANPAAAGTGLTLNAAGHVIWYSNTWQLDHRLQADDRCHRIGQDKNVQYIDLVMRGTYDVQVSASLRRKRDLAATLTKDELKDWL